VLVFQIESTIIVALNETPPTGNISFARFLDVSLPGFTLKNEQLQQSAKSCHPSPHW